MVRICIPSALPHYCRPRLRVSLSTTSVAEAVIPLYSYLSSPFRFFSSIVSYQPILYKPDRPLNSRSSVLPAWAPPHCFAHMARCIIPRYVSRNRFFNVIELLTYNDPHLSDIQWTINSICLFHELLSACYNSWNQFSGSRLDRKILYLKKRILNHFWGRKTK